ncbi:hotdog fold thioesterase [Apibacter muscae]|nr:hotdog fold thioesterase [Apibacter muscae]
MVKNSEIIDQLNQISKNTLIETLGIKFISFTEDSLIAELEVCSKVLQPMNFLHGGTSLALAETIGSCLSMTTTNLDENYVFGSEVNGYHLKPVKEGKIIAIATFIHKGRSTQVIEINIFNEIEGKKFKNCFVTMINRIVKKDRIK